MSCGRWFTILVTDMTDLDGVNAQKIVTLYEGLERDDVDEGALPDDTSRHTRHRKSSVRI